METKFGQIECPFCKKVLEHQYDDKRGFYICKESCNHLIFQINSGCSVGFEVARRLGIDHETESITKEKGWEEETQRVLTELEEWKKGSDVSWIDNMCEWDEDLIEIYMETNFINYIKTAMGTIEPIIKVLWHLSILQRMADDFVIKPARGFVPKKTEDLGGLVILVEDYFTNDPSLFKKVLDENLKLMLNRKVAYMTISNWYLGRNKCKEAIDKLKALGSSELEEIVGLLDRVMECFYPSGAVTVKDGISLESFGFLLKGGSIDPFNPIMIKLRGQNRSIYFNLREAFEILDKFNDALVTEGDQNLVEYMEWKERIGTAGPPLYIPFGRKVENMEWKERIGTGISKVRRATEIAVNGLLDKLSKDKPSNFFDKIKRLKEVSVIDDEFEKYLYFLWKMGSEGVHGEIKLVPTLELLLDIWINIVGPEFVRIWGESK